MNAIAPTRITPDHARWPVRLSDRLGDAAPAQLTTLGNLDLLALPKIGLFCSARCPGHVILSAYDQAARWRDAGRCVISGFHSPVEKECLRILLRGSQPIILCPARYLPQRIPPAWKKPLAAGRLLILSRFTTKANRVTADLAACRNELVAALATEVVIVHATPGGHLASLKATCALRQNPIASDHRPPDSGLWPTREPLS
jgi:predicted Rossmann fold nucleotide-binding protein DprA/Smf involved in DNA uptake